MFKILHTADWHLGRKFLGKPCDEEELLFIDYFLEFIIKNKIDAVLLSGDVFDGTNPPIYAEKNYFYFLKKIKEAGIRTIITSGNHDSKKKLEASYQLFEKDEIVSICTKPKLIKLNNEITISAIPFLSLDDLNVEVNGKTYTEIEHDAKKKIKEVYLSFSEKSESLINIAMGHFAIAGFAVDSTNRCVRVTDYSSVSQDDVDIFSYLAMGHLHKRQNKGTIVYSGSPFACTFGEAENERSMAVISIEDQKVNWDFVDVPVFKDVFVFKGEFDDVILSLSKYENNTDSDCYASIVLDSEISEEQDDELRSICSKKRIDLLKIILKNNNFEKTEIVNFTINQNPREIFSSIVDNSDPVEYIEHKEELLNYFDKVCDWSSPE